MRVISSTNSMIMAVPKFWRRVSGSSNDRWAAARPGVSIRTIITRGATASVERMTKWIIACQLKDVMFRMK